MKAITMATTNAGKAAEAGAILSTFGIKVEHASIELEEPKTLGLAETARAKAANAYAAVKRPVIVEDTGIFFDEFPLFPGTYTKFAARTLGTRGLGRLLEGGKRGAKFTTIAAYCDGHSVKTFEGSVAGTIAARERGRPKPGMFYDAIFIPNGARRTYAEMNELEKAKTSHRAKAFRSLGKFLEGRLK